MMVMKMMMTMMMIVMMFYFKIDLFMFAFFD